MCNLARPNRCQSVTENGQCLRDALEGSQYCKTHAKGKKGLDPEMRQYLLTEAQMKASTDRHGAVEQIKSLREEVAIARSLVERRLNMIETDSDLLAACGPVNSLLLTIERLVTSCHKLEESLGDLLAKAAIPKLAQALIAVIIKELENVDDYETIVDRISEQFGAVIENQK